MVIKFIYQDLVSLYHQGNIHNSNIPPILTFIMRIKISSYNFYHSVMNHFFVSLQQLRSFNFDFIPFFKYFLFNYITTLLFSFYIDLFIVIFQWIFLIFFFKFYFGYFYSLHSSPKHMLIVKYCYKRYHPRWYEENMSQKIWKMVMLVIDMK